MGLLGARPKARENEVVNAGSALPEGRLDQLMTFVERAAAPAPARVPDLPPRRAVVPPPAPEAATPAPVVAEVAEVTGLPALAVRFPEPIVVLPAQGGGKRRALLAS